MSKANPYQILRYLNGKQINASEPMRYEAALAMFKRAKYYDIHKADPDPRNTYWWNDRHGLNKVRLINMNRK